MNNNQTNGKDNTVAALPDLSLSDATISFLSKILIDGGADAPAFENGNSKNISAKLRSGKDGFLDRNIYPDTVNA
ncbi:MAG: hypothetical protein PHQ60_10130 [Sideroxydans sp.]|nr:hypothetical protein [Sideroxydans sp.]